MGQEKVGFGFEFGIKGDKEVKRGLEDIIRLMGSAGNATSALTGILGKAGGLLEFGKAATPIGLMATAMAIFAYKSAEAGENLRRTRFEIERLSRTPAMAMTDSDLASNQSAIIEQFRNLGLEAGNTFTLSFADRFKNGMQGASAITYDAYASVANLFGAKLPSYEQSSDEANDARNRVSVDDKVLTDRIVSAERYQQQMAAIRRKTNQSNIELYSLNYGARPGQPGTGIMPESFGGRAIQRDIQRQQDSWTIDASKERADVLKKQMRSLIDSPVPLYPGTARDDALANNAKRAADRKQDEADITAELEKQQAATQDILELNLQERQIARDFIKGQNYGSWRAVGGGGVAYIPPNFLGVNHKISGPMPKDVGYDTSHHPDKGLASTPDKATGFDGAAISAGHAALTLRDDFVAAGDAVKHFVSGLLDTTLGKKGGDEVRAFYDKYIKPKENVTGNNTLSPELKTRTPEQQKAYQDAHPDKFNVPPGGVQYFDKNGKPVNLSSANRHKIDPASFQHLTASYFPANGSISDSPVDLSGPINPSTGKYDTTDHRRRIYPHGDFPSPHMAGIAALGLPQLHPSIVTKLRQGLGAPNRHASDFDSQQKYDAEMQRLGIISAFQSNRPAHYDPTFHPGSMQALNPLGGMNSRVQGWEHPMPGFGGISGSMQGLDVLKSIDKNINKVGIPTLTQ